MVSRSIPMPQPAVGGSPYSRAVQKVSSICIASSLPFSLSCIISHPQHSLLSSLQKQQKTSKDTKSELPKLISAHVSPVWDSNHVIVKCNRFTYPKPTGLISQKSQIPADNQQALWILEHTGLHTPLANIIKQRQGLKATFTWSANRSRWTTGSFSSVYALHTCIHMNQQGNSMQTIVTNMTK